MQRTRRRRRSPTVPLLRRQRPRAARPEDGSRIPAAAALDHLAISFVVDRLYVVSRQARQTASAAVHQSFAGVDLVRCAERSEIFVLELGVPLIRDYYRRRISREGSRKQQQPMTMMDLRELPSSAKMETMHLKLMSKESLQLPATAAFTSLLDLSLESTLSYQLPVSTSSHASCHRRAARVCRSCS